ncbi:MAG: hypothetical protein ACT4PX_00965 [Actinomycetota bacterium]
MPWCEECSRFLTPTSMGTAGECPGCGRVLTDAAGTDEPEVPWHFKLLVLATVLYLGWRAVQGVVWLVGRL